MAGMRRVLALGLVFLAACGPTTEATTTTDSSAIATTTRPVTTSTEYSQDFQVRDCSAPPVTFSALCQVYQLIQEWHVDRPISDAILAQIALDSLVGYTGSEIEPRPRTFLCSVPGEEFSGFCAQLALMIGQDEIAVGPAVDGAVTAMANLGLDPFSYYLPPDQVGSFRANGVVGGVGVLLDARDAVGSRCAIITKGCPLRIVFVLEDNPGADAGLLPEDLILTVDGEAVDGLGFAATAGAIAGDETGVVTITVDRDGQTLVFEIERAELSVPTVEVDLPQSDVGYIRIPDFEDDIPELVSDGLTSIFEFSPGTLIVDLRDNPGGYVDAAVDVASEFMDGGLVMETFGPDEHLEYPAKEGGLATEPRLLVLVNGGSASAAEILAAALRDNRDAVLVGTPTFGKDAVQIPFDLRNGGEFYVAVARWQSPDGSTAGNGGLTPDVELELGTDLTIEEIVAAALDAAR